MKIYKVAKSTLTLDLLEKALIYVLETQEIKTIRKANLMPIGVLGEYGVIEIVAMNVKFPDDQVYIKVFYEVWTGEYSGHGVGKPKNVPVYRGFIEGKRNVPWGPEEEIGLSHEQRYGPFKAIVDNWHPERKEMLELGDFERVTGKAMDVAKTVKSIIDRWGNEDSESETVSTPPTPTTQNRVTSPNLVSV